MISVGTVVQLLRYSKTPNSLRRAELKPHQVHVESQEPYRITTKPYNAQNLQDVTAPEQTDRTTPV